MWFKLWLLQRGGEIFPGDVFASKIKVITKAFSVDMIVIKVSFSKLSAAFA